MNYFYFLGKVDQWENDSSPPPPASNSAANDIAIRDAIVYMRKMTPNDVSLVVTNYEWTSGTVYAQWDHTVDMTQLPFYVSTSNYNVYKCLSNNLGAASTVEPTGNSLFPFTTADGYVWKYMYNIPSFKRTKFMSRGYLPVQKALSNTFYSRGAVEQVVVNDSGSGYSNVQMTTINVVGTTTGAGATAHITSVDGLGQITGIDVDLGGNGYTAGATVTVNSTTGVGAQITIQQTGGIITGFDIVSGGYGYTLSDTVSITVGQASLIPVVSQTTGSILRVEIVNGGSGYVSAPTLTLSQFPSTGHGLYGNATAVLKAVVYAGTIVNVTVEDPGVAYPSDNNTQIVVQGDGTGAVFTPVVYDGKVIDVIIENTGTDYSFIKLTVTGTGSGAVLTGILGTSDFVSDQSMVEQVAVPGAIYAAVVTEPGDNYSTATTVTITGDGTGATATCTVEEGTISKITITSPGQGYTRATLSFTDPNRQTPNTFTDAQAYAILPPVGGHGSHAINELYADTLALFTLIRDDEELNLLAQDYRQYGILLNPTDVLTNKLVSSSPEFVTFTVKVTSVGSMAPDDILINNNKMYRVLSINGTEVSLMQMSSIYTQPSGVLTRQDNALIQYTIEQVLAAPSVNKYSGYLMYAVNNTPFTPTTEQSIAVRTYLKL